MFNFIYGGFNVERVPEILSRQLSFAGLLRCLQTKHDKRIVFEDGDVIARDFSRDILSMIIALILFMSTSLFNNDWYLYVVSAFVLFAILRPIVLGVWQFKKITHIANIVHKNRFDQARLLMYNGLGLKIDSSASIGLYARHILFFSELITILSHDERAHGALDKFLHMLATSLHTRKDLYKCEYVEFEKLIKRLSKLPNIDEVKKLPSYAEFALQARTVIFAECMHKKKQIQKIEDETSVHSDVALLL